MLWYKTVVFFLLNYYIVHACIISILKADSDGQRRDNLLKAASRQHSDPRDVV